MNKIVNNNCEHDEKKIEELKRKEVIFEHYGVSKYSHVFERMMKQYAEHMVKQERERYVDMLLIINKDLNNGKDLGLQYFSNLAHLTEVCNAQEFINKWYKINKSQSTNH